LQSKVEPIPGLSLTDQRVYELLVARNSNLNEMISTLPDISGSELQTARTRCEVPPDERVLGILTFSTDDEGEFEAGVVFGRRAIYSRNGEESHHPGTWQMTYVELNGRAIVNHGVDVWLGDDQYICAEPENTGIDCENLVALLTDLGTAWVKS